jgi:hypothetical protein
LPLPDLRTFMLRRRGKSTLFLLATTSILLLLLVSDFQPGTTVSIAQVSDGAEAELRCVVIEVHSSAKGQVLMLADAMGIEFSAFLPINLADDRILPGRGVLIGGTLSSEGDRFFFIDSFELVALPLA